MEEEQVDGLDSEAPATDRIPLGVRLFLIPFVIVLVSIASTSFWKKPTRIS